jgi:AcrR family transcriptional regulator
VRQSPEDIDRAILDVAAGIFARHGFAHTSVQQVADAVGYSKPGLLHRFGSKEALHRAVLGEVAETLQEISTFATASAGRPDQVRRVLQLFAAKALERPGMVQLMLAVSRPDRAEPGAEEIQAAGRRLLEGLVRPLHRPADRLRVLLALDLVVTAAITQHSRLAAELHVDRDTLVPLLVDLAAQVMGDGLRP